MGFHGDGITAAERGEINGVIAVNSATYTASAMHYNFRTTARRIHLLPSGQQTSFAMDRARSRRIDIRGGRGLKRRNGANNRRNEPPLSFARIRSDRWTEGKREGEKSAVKNAAAAL